MEGQNEPVVPLAGSRVRGIGEHLERAQYLFDLAQSEKDDIARYRLMLVAVYSCRAITELMLEAAEKQEVNGLDDPNPKKNREALEEQISPKLPYYSLIERIRIHDFHRFGIIPRDPHTRQVMFGGPIKLKAKKGVAAIALPPDGPKFITTGKSQIKQQRPLLYDEGLFFDTDSSNFVSLEQVLNAFLSKAPNVISTFVERVRCQAQPDRTE